MGSMESQHLSHPDLHMLLYAFILLGLIYVSVMCTCWGTLSFSKAKAQFKKRQALDRVYEATLQRREDMLYHIGAAQERGEHDQVAVLEKQFARVDRDLDLLEERLRKFDLRESEKRSKLK